MLRWFCDVCKSEIVSPEIPIRISAYRCMKSRDDADFGWGESDDVIKVFCHGKCADGLEKEIHAALSRVQT